MTDYAYGFCPKCGVPGLQRECCLNGNDMCFNGHIYPSKDAVNEPERKPTYEKLEAALAASQAMVLALRDENQIVIPGGQRIGRNYKMGIAEGLERAARYLEAVPTYVHEGTMKQFAEAIRELKEPLE